MISSETRAASLQLDAGLLFEKCQIGILSVVNLRTFGTFYRGHQCFRIPQVHLIALLTLGPATWAADTVNFDRDVRSILSNNCFQCHGPDEAQREGGVRLDTKDGVYAAIDDGYVVVPSEPDQSVLIERIFSNDPDHRMPPDEAKKTLSDNELDILRRWVEEGAEWSGHWAFVPPLKPMRPEVDNDSWVRNPIDNYVLDVMDEVDLPPSPEASRSTLIRRVSLDLTGLPPTVDEVDAFLADASDDAYDRVVDRLLASPHYGERMAWPWLDAARYADTNGYQGDNERTMYPWRDWVVDAFNSNMPYDQFTIWQLAGDLLPDPTIEQKIATGFNRNHMINGEGGRIAEENRVEYVFDQLETVGTVWMGLTFNCCRCHDHKYDPLTNKDYYSLFAFFNQTQVTGGGGDPQTPPNLALHSPETENRLVELGDGIDDLGELSLALKWLLEPQQASWEKEQIASSEEDQLSIIGLLNTPIEKRNDRQRQEIADHFFESNGQYRNANNRLNDLTEERDTIKKNTVRVMIMEDMTEHRNTYILERGLYSKRGEEVTAAVPATLPGLDAEAPRNRLGLARWLVDPKHPLMARVTVNRFWAEIFGQGLVESTENFGVQGAQPSHPELLDWLSVTFVESGWDVKGLLRLMVTSAAYCQSSEVNGAVSAADPSNRYLSRGPRFRMPSWMIRDQALFAGGLLSPKLGGPSVKPYQPDGLWAEFSFGNIEYKRDTGESLYRRSLYTYWRRIVAPPLFFDASTRQTCTVKANRTNTPLHALATLNDPGYVEAARALAGRLLAIPDATDRDRIDAAIRLIMARPAHDEECDLLIQSIARLKAQFGADEDAAKAYLSVGDWRPSTEIDPVDHAAYASLCLALINTDEALTKE